MHEQKKKTIFYVLSAISAGFLILTILISLFPDSFIDRKFSEEVQEHQNIALLTFMKMVSWFGYMPLSLIMVLVTALVFYLFKYKKEAFYILLTLISGVSSAIKIAVNRPRPSENMVNIIVKTRQQSFPSGHVLFYVVFFGLLMVFMYHLKAIPEKIRISVASICMLLIFTVPVSRVYLGAHWFTDVLGGFLLGLLYLYMLSFLYFRKPVK